MLFHAFVMTCFLGGECALMEMQQTYPDAEQCEQALRGEVDKVLADDTFQKFLDEGNRFVAECIAVPRLKKLDEETVAKIIRRMNGDLSGDILGEDS